MDASSWLMLTGVAGLLFGTYLVRRQSTRPSWGKCPSYGGRLPEPDPTADGWTCKKCGCEIDKYGCERSGSGRSGFNGGS